MDKMDHLMAEKNENNKDSQNRQVTPKKYFLKMSKQTFWVCFNPWKFFFCSNKFGPNLWLKRMNNENSLGSNYSQSLKKLLMSVEHEIKVIHKGFQVFRINNSFCKLSQRHFSLSFSITSFLFVLVVVSTF